MKTRLFKYIENFTCKKKWKFSDKNSDIFRISAQNIDCVYSLEPPRRYHSFLLRGGSNEYTQSMFWAEIWKISQFFVWKFSLSYGFEKK